MEMGEGQEVAQPTVPVRDTAGKNIVFKLITSFMYLDGNASQGYISLIWLPNGQRKEKDEKTDSI